MGPYFTKKWVLIGSLSQSFGVLISFRDSATERVKRKECDTWKIVDSAHEAGFILTLVVDNFHIILFGSSFPFMLVLFPGRLS